jgi:hypothetical protein
MLMLRRGVSSRELGEMIGNSVGFVESFAGAHGPYISEGGWYKKEKREIVVVD